MFMYYFLSLIDVMHVSCLYIVHFICLCSPFLEDNKISNFQFRIRPDFSSRSVAGFQRMGFHYKPLPRDGLGFGIYLTCRY